MASQPLKKSRLSFRRRATYALAGLGAIAACIGSTVEVSAKTYLVNGILSATPIGYGFKNLKKKIPGASLFLMVTGIEAGSIRNSIVNDIRKRHASNPDEQFTLAGISKGADVVLEVAHEVAKDNITIHYLAIVEGSGGSIPPNVEQADNFVCAHGGGLCTQAGVAGANLIRLDTGHIDMGNSPVVHGRVVANAK